MRIIMVLIGFVFSMYAFRYGRKHKLFSKISMKKWNHFVEGMFSYVSNMKKIA